jgi:poly-gamma-glutamate capsule biosynthesis protein CapA/YwtB (metallophosphatase superfamily)
MPPSMRKAFSHIFRTREIASIVNPRICSCRSTNSAGMAAQKEIFQLNFIGDVMLGRLIDQLFPTHVDEPSEARIIDSVRRSTPSLRDYSSESPWGNTLNVLQLGALNVANLETSVTTHPVPWPDKVFNYRMHPANISALKVAGRTYVSLANNHTLDFGVEGLVETVETLSANDIRFAGAGHSAAEAQRPANVPLILWRGFESYPSNHSVDIFSASDHPRDWSSVPSFHLIDYTSQTKARLKELITSENAQSQSSLKIFSVHWGPNYSWQPSAEIRELAHFLIDECGIDIVHGHSSHHVQGIDRYGGKLIIYGCGDFVDDYAITPGYRNDLSAIWQVAVEEVDHAEEAGKKKALRLSRLDIYPTKIKDFQVNLLEPKAPDHEWVREKIVALSRANGMKELPFIGKYGQLIINL